MLIGRGCSRLPGVSNDLFVRSTTFIVAALLGLMSDHWELLTLDPEEPLISSRLFDLLFGFSLFAPASVAICLPPAWAWAPSVQATACLSTPVAYAPGCLCPKALAG